MSAAPALPRAGAAQHYAADLAWLDCLIEREMLRLRATYALSQDELRGLYISDRQADERLREEAPAPGPAQRLTRLALELRTARRVDTPLAELAQRFALSPFEADVALLALAPELSLKYETLYAYLNNDVTRRHVTVDLALRLLRATGVPAERAALCHGAQLFEWGLLEWLDPGDRRPLLAHGFALSPPAALALLGLPVEDRRLPAGMQILSPPDAGDDDEILCASARKAVAALSERHALQSGLIVCTGAAAAEQLAAARLYAARNGQGVVTLPLSSLAGEAAAAAWPQTRARLRTLAILAGAVPVLYDELDGFPREPAPLLQLARQVRDLVAGGMALVWAVQHDAPWAQAVIDLPFVELALPASACEERAAAWHSGLARQGVTADAQTIDILAERFALPSSRILTAAETAARLARDRAMDLPAALWSAARRHSGQALAQLANRVTKPHTWQQLVLPEATLRQVREVASAIAQRERVYRRWRMAERTGSTHGLMALFAGASGTGKTMTAAVIANDLGVDLYRIDLASVVSKYIGETEKNLERIFQAARHSNAILFFDEADALLGKRSEVKDAHDRYANIEVAYLLQKMEEHDGVAILASNMARNLDQAFARRMHYVVEFPRPDGELRERLWRGMFPQQAPLAPDVDFAFLAGQFDTSGGDIQAIALDAAFLASAEGDAIGMAHVVKAMARHQLKQGNPGGMSGFKQYHAMAKRG
ncbi:MAG TPA: ATP-binding protein [Myxococcota bacterium]|nr:ATP-binding protein [Myxococcota bacterium]